MLAKAWLSNSKDNDIQPFLKVFLAAVTCLRTCGLEVYSHGLFYMGFYMGFFERAFGDVSIHNSEPKQLAERLFKGCGVDS